MVPVTAPTSTATDGAQSTTPLTQQPASFLARLATSILHIRWPILERIFDNTSPCDIRTLALDPDSPKPDELTTKTCHYLAYILKSNPASPSPDTIPYALCLLLRFRLIPNAVGESLVSRDVPDEMWIVMAVYLAHKFLVDWSERWNAPFRLDNRGFVRAEMEFLAVLGYRVWIKDEEYAFINGRLNELWTEVYREAAKPALPAFMVKRFGRLS